MCVWHGRGAFGIQLKENTNEAENRVALIRTQAALPSSARNAVYERFPWSGNTSQIDPNYLSYGTEAFNIHPYIYLFVENAAAAEFLPALSLREKVRLWSETPETFRHARCTSEEGLFPRASRKNIDKAVKILALITQPCILNLKLQELLSFSHLFLASLFFPPFRGFLAHFSKHGLFIPTLQIEERQGLSSLVSVSLSGTSESRLLEING